MKFRIQEKELKEAPYIIKVYNCELSHLLNYQRPFAYVSNKNGWKYDVYNPFDSCVYITTGYNPIGWRLPNEERWIIKALEDKAWTVRNDEAAVNKLLKLFIDYCFYSLVPIEYAEINKNEILDKIREATR